MPPHDANDDKTLEPETQTGACADTQQGESLAERVRRGIGLFKDLAPGVSLADELIRDRREEARREELD